MNWQLNVYTVKYFIYILLLSSLSSCVNKKNVAYFQNLSQENIRTNLGPRSKFEEPKIQPDDILAITISTLDPSGASAVNQASSLPTSGASSSNNMTGKEVSGYLVDKNGEIEITSLGKVKVAGLTTFDAKELIRSKAAETLVNPNVTVRYANFKISVLGEVAKPGAYILPNEKVSILDVLSLAGDITLYGKGDNILVFREINGENITERLNINSTDLFKSPFFYLKQNDVIYVEPSKAKLAALNAPTRNMIGIVLSGISVLVLAFTRIF